MDWKPSLLLVEFYSVPAYRYCHLVPKSNITQHLNKVDYCSTTATTGGLKIEKDTFCNIHQYTNCDILEKWRRIHIEPKRYASFTILFRSRHLKPRTNRNDWCKILKRSRTNIFFLLNAGKAAAKNHLIKLTILAKNHFSYSYFYIVIYSGCLCAKKGSRLVAEDHLNTIWRTAEVRKINTISLKPRPSGNLTFVELGPLVILPGSRERYLPLHTVLCAHFSPHCWILVWTRR